MTGNAVISCIHAAHTKYESNLLDWQRVVEIGWHLLTKQDMEKFEQMCEDGLLGGSDYVIFKDYIIPRLQKPILAHLLKPFHVLLCQQVPANFNNPLPVQQI